MNFKFNTENCELLFTLGGNFPIFTADMTAKGNTFTATEHGLCLEASFTDSPEGIISRRDTVTNISDSVKTLSSAFSKFTLDGGEYEVYTQYCEWCGESEGAWQPLVTSIGARSVEVRNNSTSAPFVAVFNKQNGHGFAYHIISDGLWEFRVTKRFASSVYSHFVSVELGIVGDDLLYDIAPGESLKLPEIIFYEFTDKRDLEAYRLHRYYNRTAPAESLPIIYDSWLGCFDDISYEKLMAQLEVAKRIGVEYYAIDAGWFGGPHSWFNSVGDWSESPKSSLNMRMLELSNEVRKAGLHFGLWFEIERAAKNAKAPKEHPEYYVYESNNYYIDFANPEAVDYIFGVLSENIKKYKIEFIKFDFNGALTHDKNHRAFIDYMKGYNEFIARIGKVHPEVYLENCAGGGQRMSLSSLRGFDSFWMSDNHSLYTQLEIYKNTMLRMPSRALEKWLTIRSAEKFGPVYEGGLTEKILTSGDALWGHVEAVRESFLRAVMKGGPIGLSCDLTTHSEKLISLLAEEIANYKKERGFWMTSECHILADTESMLVLQFNDAEYSKIKLIAFAKVAKQLAVRVYPFLDTDAEFTDSEGKIYTGDTFREVGVILPVGDRYSASETELVRKI